MWQLIMLKHSKTNNRTEIKTSNVKYIECDLLPWFLTVWLAIQRVQLILMGVGERCAACMNGLTGSIDWP